MRFWFYCLAALFCTGCEPTLLHQDLEHFIKQTYDKKMIAVNGESPLLLPRPLAFSPLSKRDPFSASSIQNSVLIQQNCLKQKDLPELELFKNTAITDLYFTGVIQQGKEFWALMINADNVLQRVAKGQIIGINHGVVENIDQQYISISEYIQNDAGCWQKHHSKLKIE